MATTDVDATANVHLVELAVDSPTDGTQVWLDHRLAGAAPITLYLPEGDHLLAAAVDDKATVRIADIADATDYVGMALDEALEGKPVSRPITRPYGCPIVY